MSARELPDDPADPYNRQEQTFPTLTPALLARVAEYGAEESLAAGQAMFSRGDRGADFFVVLDGAVEILDRDEHGAERMVTVHGAGQFTGELDLFNDREILVSGRAGPEGARVLRIKRQDFRALVVAAPDIGETVMRAFILRRVGLIRHGQGAVTVAGSSHGADTLRIRRFLDRNGYPSRFVDTDHEHICDSFGFAPADLPVVLAGEGKTLRNPSNAQLADALGLTEEIDPSTVFDLAVVGAGPGGLAAAVYGASEGLSTIVIEAMAPGGQAGTSSKIENYLGFPTGISGQALAGRAQVQAQKFGARLAVSRAAKSLDCDAETLEIGLEDGRVVKARSVVVATGARYRKLSAEHAERYDGQGVHYAATAMEGALCANEEVVVVGGGNSAGQAAVFLSGIAAHVYMLCRSEGLAATMSDYLVQRIEKSDKITLLNRTEITALHGEAELAEVEWTNRDSQETTRKPIRNVFVMIGADPNTDWLGECLAKDKDGFVLTGARVSPYSDINGGAPAFATSKAGVFAIGDVRSGSVKRVASSVGEGSVVIQAVHRYLSAGS